MEATMNTAGHQFGVDSMTMEKVAAILGIPSTTLKRGVDGIADYLLRISSDSASTQAQYLVTHLGNRAVSWFGTLSEVPTNLMIDPVIVSRVLSRLMADPDAVVGDLLAVGSGLVPWDVQAKREASEDGAPMSPGVTAALLEATTHAQGMSIQTPEAVPVLFAEQAVMHPDRLALDCIDGIMTFAALERRTRALAWRLLELGVTSDTVVAVILPREMSLIVALLAIWRAGAAFLLLDPHDPHDLSHYKLAAAEACLILCTAAYASEWSDAKQPLVVLDDLPTHEIETSRALPAVTGSDLAYVVFTSGSTGHPKGVMIEHAGLAEHVATQLAPLYNSVSTPVTALRVGGAAPVSFDSFIDQVLPMVALGHTLVLFDERGRLTPGSFLDRGLSTIDVVDCTPSQLTVLVDQGLLERQMALRLIVFGGENPTQNTWDRLRKSSVSAVSIYGATECTIGSMAADVHKHEQVNLGFPAGSARVYILNEAGHILPPGIVGEVHLAGPGVGRGYVGAQDETTRQFVPDPFSHRPGARMYRTGDLARVDSSGCLYFCGRRDDQVKIRGFRIEPGEVEAALTSEPGIHQAAVIPVPYNGRATHLVAFLVGSPNLSWSKIRENIAQRLSPHMLPARALQLDTLPLTRNGKVDRHVLAELDTSVACLSAPEPPTTDLEEYIRAIWQDVLKRDAVGVVDDFETIGGHSLAAMEIITRLQGRFRHYFDIRAILAAHTVREMATLLAEGQNILERKEA
jgi:amino acid adenylation domain-containing protein